MGINYDEGERANEERARGTGVRRERRAECSGDRRREREWGGGILCIHKINSNIARFGEQKFTSLF